MNDHQPRDAGSPIVGGACWRAPAGSELRRKSWGQAVVVFNPASRETHLLDALTAAVLDDIEQGRKTDSQLCDRFSDRFGLDTEALPDRLATTCRRLEELGLIELVRP